MIEVQNLTRYYGDFPAVQDVTFKVQDIKALMTYVYNNVNTDFLGGRCNTDDDDVDFDDYFSSALAKMREMRDEGFVDDTGDAVRVIGTGRLFVRNVAMAFDRYLEAKAKDKPVFSRTV